MLKWLAPQLTEACGWDEPPRYLIRDRDGAYGAAFIRRTRAMRIATDQSRRGRLGRTDMRRGGERHLRHVLASYPKYYNEVRTHLSPQNDAPVCRDVCRTARVRSSPILGRLQHQYIRV
jgi:hypothetical protein